MKRFTMIVALLLAVAMPLMAERVNPETARKVATTFLNNNGAKTVQLTDLSKSAGFPNLYIFSSEHGSVVVSADDHVKPVLAYSLTDKFVIDDMPENLHWWLQSYNDEIQFAIDHNIEPSKQVDQQWTSLKNGTWKNGKATPVVSPLTTTEWGQGTKDNPYWYCCPRSGDPGQYTYAKAGCVAVSMAQVMKYHSHPAQGSGSHSYQSNTYGTISADFGATTYDWNNMLATVSRNSSTAVKLAVGTLIFHCGVAVEMDYGPQASGADHADVPHALTTYFNYSNSVSRIWREDYTDSQWITILKNELDASRPLIYGGANQNYVAHSFVCDGYNSDDYFHFNWGWEGQYHGFYYSIDNLDPKYTGGAYCYNYFQDAIIGIKPASGEAPAAPSNLHCNMIGNNATLTWAAPDNDACTYMVFHNGAKIAEGLNTTTYTDVNLADNTFHYYTVKSVLNGEESAHSNISCIVLGNASIVSLALEGEDNLTLTEGSFLSLTSPLSNTDPANLVLEDGAQLLHYSNDVQATLHKSITGYNGANDGWYTIASPFASYDPANELALGTYDLFGYSEYGDSEGNEWINYKSEAFSLGIAQGYLYANNTSGTLNMTGTLNNGSIIATVTLAYGNSDNDLRGFNLLGNPTAHDINFTKTASVSDGYYYLSNDSQWVYTTESSVPVGRGFLVKANAPGETVTLNPQSKDEAAENGQYIALSIGDNTVYVKLNEGNSMPLLNLMGQHNRLYLSSNHKPYAMFVRNDATTVDLCFEPSNDGKQTLFVDTRGLKLDYLHLIDNMTGNEVDLLVMPSYTFEAKTTDYASRFKLVFTQNDHEGSSTNSETFAYISNGNIVIRHEGNATLQIMDAAGRMVASINDISESVSTANLPAGIYVLRLITGETVKTQKLVIE